ncbi:hypothetical protein [Pseudooceanicola sp. 200-1SW]|uniref:hypothetical protein n=1 Tax=Pseudooceanicola sp. 200-1SW TaxID=3425949 RepID=UPI003D7F2092
MKHTPDFVPAVLDGLTAEDISGFRQLTRAEAKRLDAAETRATAHLHENHAAHLQEKRKRRWPIPCQDNDGTDCFLVPLSDAGTEYAIIEADDYWLVRDAGGDGLWCIVGRSQGHRYVATYAPLGDSKPGYAVYPARIILRLSRGQRVRYLNGDTLDLRRKNLIGQAGAARLPAGGMLRIGARLRDKIAAEGRLVGVAG